jgi:uroporphyrin-III C-methyltransferase
VQDHAAERQVKGGDGERKGFQVDDLVGEQLLAAVLDPAAAPPRIVQVGKRGGCASTPQHFICKLLVREAGR